MINYGKTKSTVRPNGIVTDEKSVWVHTNIVEITEEEFIGYEYDMVQYDKDEYITLLAEKNISLEDELTSTQLALVEIYEDMGV